MLDSARGKNRTEGEKIFVPLRIVKLGGSLLDLPGVADRLRTWLAGQPPAATLLVVGGGLLADAIRQAQRVHGLDDAAAHRLCLDVMGVTAALACELLPGATLVRRPDGIDRSAPGRLQIVDVREFLLAGADPLPQSWQVTSDSIAAHLAAFLGAEELVLLKSTLPRSELAELPASPRALADQGMVDDYFPCAVQAFLAGAARRAGGNARVRLVNPARTRGLPKWRFWRPSHRFSTSPCVPCGGKCVNGSPLRLTANRELGQQRLEIGFVAAPARQRAAVQRPADLNVAGGGDRPAGFVKAQAAIVPGQAAIVDQPPGLLFQVVDHVLVRRRRAWRRPAEPIASVPSARGTSGNSGPTRPGRS